MDFDKLMEKSQINIEIKEEDMRRVAELSRETFLKQESNKILPYHQFLFSQFLMIRKHWWGIQLLILGVVWYALMTETEAMFLRRDVSILSVLFIIAVMPELWKNLSNRCMEVEMSAFYSLHHIYAARLLLFGLVDVVGISIFATGIHNVFGITITEILLQMLIPMTVTAGICFLAMDKKRYGIGLPAGCCVGLCAFWWWFCGNENLYTAIAPAAWISIFFVSCVFLLYTVARLLKHCNEYPEVGLNETCIR